MHETLKTGLAERIIAIDFEFRDDEHPPYKVGVFSPDTGNAQAWDIDKKNEIEILDLIDKICSHKEIILGHNIIAHDLRLLQKFYPRLNLHTKPVIDTLLLSPLAFPKWPYHKLIKDYKLVSYSKNRPEDDARLSWSLFVDEIANLTDHVKVSDEIFTAYASWFLEADSKGGFQRLFETLYDDRKLALNQVSDILPSLKNILKDRACSTDFEKVFSQTTIDPLAKAFSLSWLYGADEFSILSRWVRLQYPDVQTILNQLRDIDCGKSNCAYCRSAFDLNSHLKRYFGFDSRNTSAI